jgi:putative endonuclease
MGTRVMTPRRLGVRAEWRAAWFYRLRGYRVVARNVRTRYGELDLIVRRGRSLAFVEVKARQSLTAGEGLEAVTPAKQRRIEQLAAAWLVRNPHDGPIRYDVLSMQWTGWRFRVTHVRDAWGW